MKPKKEHLELRKRIKSKKPEFIRQDAHKRVRLEKKWRKPKGLHAKMRLKKRGYRRCVTKGWGSPNDVKGCHSSGLKFVLVSSLSAVENVNPKEDGILIASSVGIKKKTQIIAKAKEKGIAVLNVRDVEGWIKGRHEKLEKEREQRKSKLEKKTEKKKELEKKTQKKEEKLDEKLTEEEKKQKEKEEKDKILTKKQ